MRVRTLADIGLPMSNLSNLWFTIVGDMVGHSLLYILNLGRTCTLRKSIRNNSKTLVFVERTDLQRMNKSLFLTPSTHLSISSCQVDFENAFKWLETVALERGSRYATDYVARSPILLLLLPYLAITLWSELSTTLMIPLIMLSWLAV